MDISAITSEITAGSRINGVNPQPAEIGKEFETLLFEMLLKSSGFSAAFTGGDEGAQETALFGDLAIQVMASEMAREMDLGLSQALTTKNR